MRVVDASVVVEALTGPPVSLAIGLLAVGEAVAPEFIDIEVVHSLRRLTRGGAIAPEEGEIAVYALEEMPIIRRSHRPFLPRIWQLRHNLTAYDATYVALAEALGCPLVTADARLASAPGVRCEIVVFGPEPVH